LLAPSTIGVFLSLSDSLIDNFIEALDTCIKDYIISGDELHSSLIKYYIGFFIDLHSKIDFQRNLYKQHEVLKSSV